VVSRHIENDVTVKIVILGCRLRLRRFLYCGLVVSIHHHLVISAPCHLLVISEYCHRWPLCSVVFFIFAVIVTASVLDYCNYGVVILYLGHGLKCADDLSR
ncbi:hypothetical protein PIB30_092012, partial [Stylosanthes scabra]|nr:hypothetical protein [Stylosanthes scabra]